MSFYSRAQLSTVCLCPLSLTSDSARFYLFYLFLQRRSQAPTATTMIAKVFHSQISLCFDSVIKYSSSLSMIAKSTMARDNSQYESNCAGGVWESLWIIKRGEISDNHYFMAFCLCVYYLILITCLVQNKEKCHKIIKKFVIFHKKGLKQQSMLTWKLH